MDDQKRFTLAMLLSGIILAAYYFFYLKPTADEARLQAQEDMQANAQVQQAQVIETPAIDRSVLIAKGTRIKINTPKLSGSFSTTGSRFDDLILKDFKQTLDEDSGNVIMFSPEGAKRAAYAFDNWTTTNAGNGLGNVWEVVEGTALTMATPVTLKYTAANYTVQRVISIDENYLFTLDDTVTNTSSQEISLVRKGAARQHGLADDLMNFMILHEGPVGVLDNKQFDMSYKKVAKKASFTKQGEGGWVGLTDKYWLSAAIAPQGQKMKIDFTMESRNNQDVYETAYTTNPTTLSPNTSIQSKGFIYAGAKQREVLHFYQENPDHKIAQFERAIDWGFLGVLSRPMFWAMNKFGKLTGNYGVAILLVTLILKLILFPLNNKAYASMAKMKLVQPKIKKMQKRYGDDKMKLQKEMMALYRKEGVSPVAGCLPMIPQMFIFFALYKTLLINMNMRHAPFIGYIKDLTANDHLSILNGFGLFPWDGVPIAVLSVIALGPLAILYGITMGLMQTLNTPPADKTQARIFQLMPIFFMFILARFPVGLLLYWVWNNILTIAQQYYITRKYKVETPLDRFFAKITGKGTKSANDG